MHTGISFNQYSQNIMGKLQFVGKKSAREPGHKLMNAKCILQHLMVNSQFEYFYSVLI